MGDAVLVNDGAALAEVVGVAGVLPALLDMLEAGLEAGNEVAVVAGNVGALDDLAVLARLAVAGAGALGKDEASSVSLLLAQLARG